MRDEQAALFERLYGHVAWANARVADALTRSGSAQAMAMFSHVLGAEEIWLARLEGRDAELGVWPELSVDECVRRATRLAAGYRDYCDGLAADDWARDCHYTTTDGRGFVTPIADILLHVALHGAYHRGQIASWMRQGGESPATTDFIEYARGGPAAKRQDG